MSKFMLLILDPPTMTEARAAKAGSGLAEMGRFAGELAQSGKLKDAAPLGAFRRAKRVRKKGGRVVVTDGPFTETKELVSGYFVIEAKDRREAVAVARCESRLQISAQNGQYLGLFQMGVSERVLFGHGESAVVQARAAYRYFVRSGRDWSPWSCKPRS